MCLHRDDDPGFEVDLISIWLNNHLVHVPDHQIVVESRHHIIVEHSLVDFVPCSPDAVMLILMTKAIVLLALKLIRMML